MTFLRCKPASCAFRRSCAVSVECRSLWYPRTFRALYAVFVCTAVSPVFSSFPSSSSSSSFIKIVAGLDHSPAHPSDGQSSPPSSSYVPELNSTPTAAGDGCLLSGLMTRRFRLDGAPAIDRSCDSTRVFCSSAPIFVVSMFSGSMPATPFAAPLYLCAHRQSCVSHSWSCGSSTCASSAPERTRYASWIS